MIISKTNYLINKLSLATLFVIVALLSASCNRKFAFQTSAIVPAAKGYTKVTKDNNNNYVIKIEITDLADVQRLQPPKKTYVVWMVTNETITKNIGQIKSSSSISSSRMKASFETVSTLKPTKVFITAEDDGSTQSYSNQIVLVTKSF
ncbi:MAG: hypothetical protein NTZ59_10115 [Bacteroidetes bacterium]|nr:hypothetical protein [Bacteroidota bacterium]